MSLVRRKPRPLVRGPSTLRDDRLFIVACDDTYAPKQYFAGFRFPRVQVHVVPAVDGKSAPEHVLNRLQQFDHDEDDERWLLLDTDHNVQAEHMRGLTNVLREARNQGIRVALSRPCFEIWLLLHHLDPSEVRSLADASEAERLLRSLLGAYNKTNLDNAKFSRLGADQAAERAARLDSAVEGGDIPQANTTRVYQLWHAIRPALQR